MHKNKFLQSLYVTFVRFASNVFLQSYPTCKIWIHHLHLYSSFLMAEYPVHFVSEHIFSIWRFEKYTKRLHACIKNWLHFITICLVEIELFTTWDWCFYELKLKVLYSTENDNNSSKALCNPKKLLLTTQT